jgi:two-component system, OmpR family, phosphate regulon sensor histidine kinase PhoR
MSWFLLLVAIGSTVALACFVWQKWIAPWSRIAELVEEIAATEKPRTFVIRGGSMPRRVAVALEKIFDRQRQLTQQVTEGASGIETILGAMQDGLLVVDAARHVTLANDTFAELFDVRETSLGAPLLDTVRDTTLDQMIAETLDTGESRRREITASGRELEVSAVPLQDEVDETPGVVVLVHDITQRKRLDEVRKDFVANVSHELRTPLSILRGYIETLRENPETSPKELSRILEVMERHSKRLGLLVEDLLSLAQLESPDPNLQLSDVNLEELFANIVRDWEKALAGKRLKMIVDLPAGLPTIRADDTRLQEILYNLLDNAVKYSSKGGEIHLRARKRDGEMAISVSDTGVGIRPEDLPRIFERFYRVDKARSREVGGTGLGLSIVKHIAQLHGGSVEAESVVGQGTTIHVVIPIVAAPVAAIVTQT